MAGGREPDRLCTVCATWSCTRCGWSRPNANRGYPQSCGRCSDTAGTWTPTRHHSPTRAAQHAAESEKERTRREAALAPDGVDLAKVPGMDLVRLLHADCGLAVYLDSGPSLRRVKVQSVEYLETRRELLETLQRLERTVRDWVRDHPES
jgi:hypothetical protein